MIGVAAVLVMVVPAAIAAVGILGYRRMSLLPRWVHQAWARWRGFFWLPCPLCARPFGGHEWRDIGGRPSTVPVAAKMVPGASGVEVRPVVDAPGPFSHTYWRRGICPACTRAGRGHDNTATSPAAAQSNPRHTEP